MIAISSYRPLKESPEADANREKAWITWAKVFSRVIYSNDYGPIIEGLRLDINQNRNSEPPSIKLLAHYAAMESAKEQAQTGWAALINADIQVDPKAARLESELNRVGAKCGFSLRFAPGEHRVRDLGIDFFVGTQEVWSAIAEVFPPEYQMGKQRWDTSMLAHMANMFPNTCFDLTPCRLIFHPPHGQRGDQSIEVPASDRFINCVRWPKQKLIY